MLSMTSVILLWLTYSYKPITWELAALNNAASRLNTIFSWEFLDFPIVILTHNVPCRTNTSESNKYNRCIICPIPIRNRWKKSSRNKNATHSCSLASQELQLALKTIPSQRTPTIPQYNWSSNPNAQDYMVHQTLHADDWGPIAALAVHNWHPDT